MEVPLMTRRLEEHKEDPIEELMEVYQDVNEMEEDFKKTLNIANFIIAKHNEVFEELVNVTEEWN